MFEGSLVESRRLVASPAQKWTALGSLTFQLGVAGVLIALPMLRPETLQVFSPAAPLAVPVLRRPPVVVQPVRVSSASVNGMSAPAASAPVVESRGSTIRFRPFSQTGDDVPLFVGTGPMSSAPNGTSVLNAIGNSPGPGVVVAPRHNTGPVKVSQGVSAGMLLTPIQPAYPPIARAAGVQGTVVMEAVISKAGRIESLHLISGPPLLVRSAMDAVATARYRPYLLNGEPVDVETTIRVVFQLGG